jgi:pyrimidine deaminase RibD-like protein
MMELTVIRTDDRRRMVVAVEAGSEAEALRAIQNAVGPVILDAEQVVVRRRGSGPSDRHARTMGYF